MNTQEYINAGAKGDLSLAKSFPAKADSIMGERLIQYTTSAMKERLKACRDKGRGGWWNSDECSIQNLENSLAEHINKGDWVDVINLSAMIYVRQIYDASLEVTAEPEL